ncbi:MAG: HPr family phosphocarrier protein [Pseudobutyrivibrio sp.]|nr:HPr family phosphocarrier protein [Pseudobutyrivibrio sp.]
MVSKKITVTNAQGLHMRPATVFSQAVTKFQSDVKVVFNGTAYDAKSVMMLMAACIKSGSEIEVQCSGSDEKEALDCAIKTIESGLGD